MTFSRRQLVRQSPWIPVLLQTVHDIIGNSVAFFLAQLLAKPAHKFARTPQREGDSEAQQIAAGGHSDNENR